MSKLVVKGASLTCSMGQESATFSVAPSHDVDSLAMAAGNVDDHVPNANVPSFMMCQSMSNPTVAAATAAAQGTLTPQPCVPVLPQPWSPGASSVTVANRPALHDRCTCSCQWGGTISVASAGQGDVYVD